MDVKGVGGVAVELAANVGSYGLKHAEERGQWKKESKEKKKKKCATSKHYKNNNKLHPTPKK